MRRRICELIEAILVTIGDRDVVGCINTARMGITAGTMCSVRMMLRDKWIISQTDLAPAAACQAPETTM
jgi:hypothetical protein